MTATQQKAAPRRGTGQAANNQQRPHHSSPWPDCNPAEVRSEAATARVLAILDAIKTEGRGR
jgi:hypothetical protein